MQYCVKIMAGISLPPRDVPEMVFCNSTLSVKQRYLAELLRYFGIDHHVRMLIFRDRLKYLWDVEMICNTIGLEVFSIRGISNSSEVA